jgi:hypothetical protein
VRDQRERSATPHLRSTAVIRHRDSSSSYSLFLSASSSSTRQLPTAESDEIYPPFLVKQLNRSPVLAHPRSQLFGPQKARACVVKLPPPEEASTATEQRHNPTFLAPNTPYLYTLSLPYTLTSYANPPYTSRRTPQQEEVPTEYHELFRGAGRRLRSAGPRSDYPTTTSTPTPRTTGTSRPPQRRHAGAKKRSRRLQNTFSEDVRVAFDPNDHVGATDTGG